jgi:hypothetical protein
VRILRNFVQFGGHASRTPCAAMNFGFGHGSRHPVPNVKCVTSGPNLPQRCKKGRIFENFRLECRIFGGVTPNFVGCRSAESVFWVTGHNPCRIERNCAVLRMNWVVPSVAIFQLKVSSTFFPAVLRRYRLQIAIMNTMTDIATADPG